MKCLHLIHRYWPARGGSEKFFIEISERLVADGNEVTVFTTDALDIQHYWLPNKERIDNPRETHNGVDIRRFNVKRLPKHSQALRVLGKIPGLAPRSVFSFPSPLAPGMLKSVFSSERFDIVHATALPYDSILYCAYRIAKRQEIPLVYSPFFHLGEEGVKDVRRFYTRGHQMRLIKSADRVLVQTGIERDFLAASGFPHERMVLLGMGINPSELAGGDGTRFRRKHDIAGPIVCYIGPRTYDKGTFHLLDAMEKLWAGGDPSTLVLAGMDIEDFRRYHAKLPARLKSKCVLLDYVPEQDKLDLLDACNLLALPSRSDSFGIVFLEAWFYGKPVVGALAGGIPGLVRDGIDGLLVSFGDVKELALSIQKLLLDQEYARSLGEAGRQRTLAEFTWDKKYAVVKQLYEELTGAGVES
ncbi:MAG: glycosyltransferase family 1 protein [Candidatus Anoxymicrobium japonicum]|uniref:Glycosyltransferase family 1 protein n=1 Tax=Candidatus Anoxymicrobium japonicum TaxID=2013648 RepID=A0A2N3G8A4_9ACTN|nr:MAG: glycosyltransferase family 1 protein [Candidatus Anoxymicrobium japonicum]